jgi:glycosyltransferase involved in cell wall biosynthesis
MPQVIMEGMASGLAVISTNVGAVNLLVSKENGYLLELNELGDLHQIIYNFTLMNKAQIDNMKNKSVELIKKKFLWSHIAQLHLIFFTKALAEKSVN